MQRIAINGFGRIGRGTYKRISDLPDFEVVCVNDLGDEKVLRHLLKHDSLYGRYDKEVKAQFLSERDPEKLPWRDLGVDTVIECTGVMQDKESASGHLRAGANRVIISSPPKDDTPVYLPHVNEKDYSGEQVISMGSCTTNCLTPLVKVLDEEFGLEKGFLTTTHSYTNSQVLLDNSHKDLRRARSASLNIVPTTTGATDTVEKVLPLLRGKLCGLALRVPVPVVSIVDFVCILKRKVTREEINETLEKHTAPNMRVEKEPLVSSDFKGDPCDCIIDAPSTQVTGDMVKILAWYDNEFAYCNSLAELLSYISTR